MVVRASVQKSGGAGRRVREGEHVQHVSEIAVHQGVPPSLSRFVIAAVATVHGLVLPLDV